MERSHVLSNVLRSRSLRSLVSTEVEALRDGDTELTPTINQNVALSKLTVLSNCVKRRKGCNSKSCTIIKKLGSLYCKSGVVCLPGFFGFFYSLNFFSRYSTPCQNVPSAVPWLSSL